VPNAHREHAVRELLDLMNELLEFCEEGAFAAAASSKLGIAPRTIGLGT
jgi:hypothetical protein